MRIQYKFESLTHQKGRVRPNKHAIQGFLYKALQDTSYSELHDSTNSKSFVFSDWFNLDRFNKTFTFYVSSPYDNLIESFYRYHTENIETEFYGCKITEITKSKLPQLNYLKTGSPVVLVEDANQNRYHSFKRNSMTLQSFNDEIKRRAIQRYRTFSGNEDFNFDGNLFTQLEIRNEVPVNIRREGEGFLFIGSTWNKLFLNQRKDLSKFKSWLQEAGVGQKRAWGFGFLQPFKLSRRQRHV